MQDMIDNEIEKLKWLSGVVYFYATFYTNFYTIYKDSVRNTWTY